MDRQLAFLKCQNWHLKPRLLEISCGRNLQHATCKKEQTGRLVETASEPTEGISADEFTHFQVAYTWTKKQEATVTRW
jgi:hypothetical protein